MTKYMILGIFLFLVSLSLFACEPTERIIDGDKDTEHDIEKDAPETADGDMVESDIEQNETEYDQEIELAKYADDEAAQIEISGFALTENPSNCLSFYADWKTDVSVATKLYVHCSDGYEETFEDEEGKTDHSVFVMGLLGKSQCVFQAIAEDASGLLRVESKYAVIKNVPEPFPNVELKEYNPRKMQAGWTIFNLVATWDDKPLSIAMVDEKGRYRWYYKVPTQFIGSDNVVRVVENGVLIGGTVGKVYPQRINWEGTNIWKAQFYMHHDILPWGDGQYLYLSLVNTCSGGVWEDSADKYTGSMHIWDVEQNDKVWNWAMCDYYIPEEIFDDWSHLNSIDPFPEENAVLLSSRNQNALFKVNMDSGEIIWKLGVNGDFEISAEDQFYGQHAAELQEDGNILLFDNGFDNTLKTTKHSRAIEIHYDEENMKAEVIWQYIHDEILYKIWGDADRLDNGNVLITFGKDYGNTCIVEVTHEDEPEVVWEISPQRNWGVYRSDRITNPPKGYVIK